MRGQALARSARRAARLLRGAAPPACARTCTTSVLSVVSTGFLKAEEMAKKRASGPVWMPASAFLSP